MATPKTLCALATLLLFVFFGNAQAQECTLDIGGKNADSVIEIFQLNEAQQLQMEELRTGYSITYKAIDEEMQKLLSEHPQSTPDELTTMAEKYRALKEKMVSASRAVDKKLLASFNQRQYDLYLSLCFEAFRRPIQVTPVIYDGPTGEKK